MTYEKISLRDCYKPWSFEEWQLKPFYRICRRFRKVNKKLQLTHAQKREVLETLHYNDFEYLQRLLTKYDV